jgi:hypothetical protein
MQTHNSVSQPNPKRHARPRAGARASVNRRAVLLLPRSGRPHPVLLRNISISGACVVTDATLAIGDDVTLRVDKDEETKLALKAIIVGVRPLNQAYYTEYGMRFVSLTQSDAAVLASFVERLPKRT